MWNSACLDLPAKTCENARAVMLINWNPDTTPPRAKVGINLTFLQILTNPHPTGTYRLVNSHPGGEAFVTPRLTFLNLA